ncbi:uncharacterized protein LOC110272178 [Arachis ipaensis]|uniref:uncharacterized protein LOC110272178 n=1 Tax=Arachis ipaensis TaxID=130454 RepID=UPI000A2B9621|nr:uncharacterized protein LOC110272178 [Arachis ipaensis]
MAHERCRHLSSLSPLSASHHLPYHPFPLNPLFVSHQLPSRLPSPLTSLRVTTVLHYFSPLDDDELTTLSDNEREVRRRFFDPQRRRLVFLSWSRRCCPRSSSSSLPLVFFFFSSLTSAQAQSTYCLSLYEHYIATRHTMHIYSQALEKLPPHIQQVNMESNGKGVLIDGVPLPFEAGEVAGSNHDELMSIFFLHIQMPLPMRSVVGTVMDSYCLYDMFPS